MLTPRDIHKFLNGKLEFERKSGKSHHQYVLFGKSGKVRLPTNPVIPRHKGDLSRTVLKNTADAFGLSLRSLPIGCQCDLSASCVLLCLAAKVFEAALRWYERDQDEAVSQPMLSGANATAEDLLDRAAKKMSTKWNKDERRALEEARKRFTDLFAQHMDRIPAIKRWLETAKLDPEGGRNAGS